MQPPSCVLAQSIAALTPGVPAGALVAVLLGIEPAKEVDTKTGDRTFRSVLTVADASRPSGVEITIWGTPALRLAYLRPLQIIHIPSVTLLIRIWTNQTETKTTRIESIHSRTPHKIVPLLDLRIECNCAKSQVVRELHAWNHSKHGELANVVLSARPPIDRLLRTNEKTDRKRKREERVPADENGQVINAPNVVPIRWIRGVIKNVCIRATGRGYGDNDVGKMLQDAVVKVCRACKETIDISQYKCTKCMPYSDNEDSCVAYVLDEERVAVRMEIHDRRGEETDKVIARCAGEDLARLLLIDAKELLQDKDGARNRAARVLSALSSDKSEFEIAVQNVGAQVRLRTLRF